MAKEDSSPRAKVMKISFFKISFFVVENRKRKFQAVDNVGQENQWSTSTNVLHKISEESYTFALKIAKNVFA